MFNLFMLFIFLINSIYIIINILVLKKYKKNDYKRKYILSSIWELYWFWNFLILLLLVIYNYKYV